MNRFFAILAGLFLATGSLVADTPAPPPLLNGVVRGIVTDVKGPNVTIMRSIVVDTGSARVTRHGKSVGVDVLSPGARVTIAISTTRANKPGVLLADTITVDASEATVNGPLEASSAKSVKLLGQQFAIADDTYFGGFVDGKAVQSTADLKNDYPVEVEVGPGVDGPTAVSVIAIGPSPRAPQPPPVNHGSVSGAVTGIDKNVWSVNGTTVYVVDNKTVLTGSPKVGDTVRVEGLRTPEGAIIAHTIVKQ